MTPLILFVDFGYFDCEIKFHMGVVMGMAQFIERTDSDLRKTRGNNLAYLERLHGRGFQKMLVDAKCHIDATSLSQFCNGKSLRYFDSNRARSLELALSFPRGALDVEHSSFKENITTFKRFSEKSSEERAFINQLISLLE